jgi:hypothetical protein
MSTTTAKIEELESQVRQAFDRAAEVRDQDPMELVTDPAARFAAERAVHGGALAQNGATVTALRQAHRQLAGA